MLERIDLSNPEWGFTFSSCVIAGDFIFTAHHSGYDYEAGRWPEGIEEQTEQCFRNLKRTLGAAGVTLDDVVKVTLLLKNAEDFPRIRAAFRRHFVGGYPARTGGIIQFLDSECLVQMDAVAYRSR